MDKTMERVGPLIIDLKDALSRNNVNDLDHSVIKLAIEHVIGSKNEFGDEACDALKNAINTVVENANGRVSTHDANERLKTLAKKISANRGFIRVVVSDTLDFIGPIKAGIAGITSSIIIQWNWMNFISSMSAFQALALTPAGMVATTGAVMSWKTFTPEGGFTFLDYIKFGLGHRQISDLLPPLAKIIDTIPARQNVVKISSWGNVFDSAFTILDNLGGNYLTSTADIFARDVEHAYGQLSRHADRASGSVRAVTNVMYAWIFVFLVIFVIFFFIHAKSSLIGFLSRSSSDPSGAHPYNASSRRRAPSTATLRVLEDGEGSSEDSGFRSKRSNKKKKSVKRSAKKRSSKTTIKRTKKSTRR
jgi:hypothetical protein